MNLSFDAQNTSCAAFWIRMHHQQFTEVGASQTLGSGRPETASSRAAAPDSGCMSERDTILEALAPFSQNLATSVRATWQHPPMVVRHRSTSTSTLNNMLTNVPQDSGLKCTGKRSVSGLSSRRRSRAARTACQPSTRKWRKRDQYLPEGFGDSTDHHSWRLSKPGAAQTVDPASDESSLWD